MTDHDEVMDIRHLTAALSRANLRIGVEQEDNTARISARDLPVLERWVREHSAVIHSAHTILRLSERDLDQHDVYALARAIEDAQRLVQRRADIQRGRIPGGGLSGAEVAMLARRGFLR